MTTAIIIVALVVICVVAIRSYAKKLKNGCCGGGEGEEKLKVEDKNVKNYPFETTVKIKGMTCNNCRIRVENAFNGEPGLWADVDLKSETAHIRSKQEISSDQIQQIVEHAGYSVA